MTTHVAQLDGASIPVRGPKRSVLENAALLLAGLAVLFVGFTAFANLFLLGDVPHRGMTEQQRMNVIVSAIKQYQLDHGDYAPTLAALTPEFLEETPIDAWRRPFVYAPTPGGVHPFTLYSTGASGKDMIDHWNPPESR